MENEGMDEGDLGSGWLQVKKKHRSSSKFSVRSTSGGASSSETYSARPHSQHGGNTRRGRHPKYSRKSSSGSVAPATACDGNVGSSASGVETVERCSSKEADCPSNSTTISSSSKLDENPARVPKIKWGNLDDDALIISKCSTDSVGNSMIECVHHASLDDEAAVDGDPLTSGAPLCLLDEESSAATLKNADPLSDNTVHESITKESHEESCREVNEIPPEDANLKVSCCHDAAEVHDELLKPSHYENGADSAAATTSCVPCPSMVSQEMSMPELQSFNDKHLDTDTDLSKSSFIENSSIHDCVSSADNAPHPQDDELVTTEEQVSLTEGLVVIDDGRDESKERFRQRLWCFLFENLNRAIDELYLLCELECDTEQMEEAMLVLDEAGSDFKELKSRVEGFERCKRYPSQLIRDGMSRTDHRRPHALSWEVRRMTRTPNRAEILSSSIEAFRQIQKERAEGYSLQDFRISGGTGSSQNKSEKCQNNLSGNKDTPLIHKNLPEKHDVQASRRASSVRSKKQVETSVLQRNALSPFSDLSRVTTKTSSRIFLGVSKECPLELDNEKSLNEIKAEKEIKYQVVSDKEKERQSMGPWKPMDAWKEKRNWEDILRSPIRSSSRISHSPCVGRKSVDRGRVLHQKLMSPEKKRKTTLDMKREAEDRHARAMRIRSQLENERVQRLQRTSEKLNRVNEWQAVRSLKMRERMTARHQRSESRHEAHLAQVARRAGDESSKVNEVRFITSLNEENKKLILRQKLHDSEVRRAEKLQVIRTKQKEDSAREEAVLERKKLLEAEKLQRITEMQRRKEEAKLRREEERKASSAAREARAVEQLRRKEDRARAQQEEAVILAQKLAERLKESEQRRKYYLEQIRERASMDFRDMKVRSLSTNSVEEYQAACGLSAEGSLMGLGDGSLNMSLKRRIKKIRQRLMALKHEFSEPPLGGEFSGIGFRSTMGAARAKIGRWLQELQRHRQARKEGAVSIGLIVVDMIKYLEGKEPELHAARKAGLIDFIASALPASHTSKPEACQVTRYLLRLLQVVLSMAANKSYFLSQNLLPPIIPMLSASLENYIKIAASSNLSGTSITSNKTYAENLETIAEVLDGFLCIVAKILGHIHSDELQLQMRNGLVELVVSYQIIHRLRDLFALYDRPQVEGSPFPSSILLSLNLLAVLTSRSAVGFSIDWVSHISNAFPETRRTEDVLENDSLNLSSAPLSDPVSPVVSGNRENQISDVSISSDFNSGQIPSAVPMKIEDNSQDGIDERSKRCKPIKDVNDVQKEDTVQKKPESFLILAISETGLVSLPSLLTAVLLQANNRQSSEQTLYALPSNFEEVATGVLKVLNNIALQDVSLLQNMLARPDLQMEFFHLMSFLLSHCNIKWKVANDQVGLLLLESLLLLGYFALFHPGNQEVLCWGKNPTILHKVCDLPFVFFSDPELSPILAGTLVAACYGCEQNRDVVQQELSTEMLLTLLRSCKHELLCARPASLMHDSSMPSDPTSRINQTAIEQHKRVIGRGIGISGGMKASRSKIQHNGKTKTCEDWALKHNRPASSASSTFMLHSRLPRLLLDKAEEFFLAGIQREPA